MPTIAPREILEILAAARVKATTVMLTDRALIWFDSKPGHGVACPVCRRAMAFCEVVQDVAPAGELTYRIRCLACVEPDSAHLCE